jgi:hypothetical protein
MMDNGCIYGNGTCQFSRALELSFEKMPTVHDNIGQVGMVWEFRGLLSDWMGLAQQLPPHFKNEVGNTLVHFARDWISSEVVGATYEVASRGAHDEEIVFHMESRLPTEYGRDDYGWYQANRFNVFDSVPVPVRNITIRTLS